MTKSQIKALIGITLILSSLIWGCYYFYVNHIYIEVKQCGVVIDKRITNNNRRYVNSIQETMYIKFDNGIIDRKIVDPDTYYKYNTDDRICFNVEIKNPIHNPFLYCLSFLFVAMTIIILLILVIGSIGQLFIWLFEIEY